MATHRKELIASGLCRSGDGNPLASAALCQGCLDFKTAKTYGMTVAMLHFARQLKGYASWFPGDLILKSDSQDAQLVVDHKPQSECTHKPDKSCDGCRRGIVSQWANRTVIAYYDWQLDHGLPIPEEYRPYFEADWPAFWASVREHTNPYRQEAA
jgi:hypothetical protein